GGEVEVRRLRHRSEGKLARGAEGTAGRRHQKVERPDREGRDREALAFIEMPPILRLYEDVLSNDSPEFGLPPAPRMIFVVHGAATFEGRAVGEGEAWHGEGELMVEPGPAGATCWRFELVPGDASEWTLAGGATRKKLAAPLDTLPKGELLLRGDSVAFPPGGCAYLHRHQGPGIRCLIEGGIRIDTHGRSTSYGPGAAWFEDGPEPVFAQ